MMRSGLNAQKELTVVVTMASGSSGWEQLCPHPELKVGRCRFLLNPTETCRADFWIVFANARPADAMVCAPENTLLIVGEPAEKKIYPLQYYRQFFHVVDTHEGAGHPRCHLHAPCFSWHVGLNHQTAHFDYGYEDLARESPPAHLSDRISLVCSEAAHTPGQVEWLHFLEQLKARMGDRIVHFGRGFQPVSDKMEAIRGFRLHLVLENCQAPHYWTEKLSDAYLGWSFPYYAGCTNLGEYFDPAAFCRVDLNAADVVAAKISEHLKTPVSERESRLVAGARDRILNVYNPWVQWARWAEQLYDPAASPKPICLRSHKAFRPFPQNLIYRAKSCFTRRE